MDLKAITEIDHNALDVEWIEHPGIFMEVSMELVEEKKKLKKLQMRADMREADAAKEIKEDPEKFGLKAKPTIPDVKGAVDTHEDVLSSRKKIIEQEYEVAMLSACVGALDHKKRALESLVTLHGQQYFASSKEPRNLDTEYLAEAGKRRARQGRKSKE